MKERTKLELEQLLTTVALAIGIFVVMVIETAAMYAGAALVLIDIAVIIYSLARHGHHAAVPEPVRVRVFPQDSHSRNLRKAA